MILALAWNQVKSEIHPWAFRTDKELWPNQNYSRKKSDYKPILPKMEMFLRIIICLR